MERSKRRRVSKGKDSGKRTHKVGAEAYRSTFRQRHTAFFLPKSIELVESERRSRSVERYSDRTEKEAMEFGEQILGECKVQRVRSKRRGNPASRNRNVELDRVGSNEDGDVGKGSRLD